MLRTYTIPGVPPPSNQRLRPVTSGFGRARLVASDTVASWKDTSAAAIASQQPEYHAKGRVAVCLVLAYGSDRKDADSGVKDALDALAAQKCKRWDVTLTNGALYANDRQVAALFVVKDYRKGEQSTTVAIAPIREVAAVAHFAVAVAEDVEGMTR